MQGRAKQLIHEIYLSPTRKAALAAYDQFITSYQTKYPKATECLQKELDSVCVLNSASPYSVRVWHSNSLIIAPAAKLATACTF